VQNPEHLIRISFGRLDRQRERFGFQVRAVGLDTGCSTAAIAKGLEDRDIYAVIGYRTTNHAEGLFRKRQFRYDAEGDVYVCPNPAITDLPHHQPQGLAAISFRRAAVPRLSDAPPVYTQLQLHEDRHSPRLAGLKGPHRSALRANVTEYRRKIE
jgi:hypothetical protein